MNEGTQDFSSFGFAKTFVLPALWVFLIPVLTLLFFLHAQSKYDAELRQELVAQVRNDETLTAEEKSEAVEFYESIPFSRLLRHPEFAEQVDSELRFYYATFRWMILLSLASIVSGVVIFLLGGLCVLLSLRSQRAQYYSLSVGWHVLRIYSALQTIAQGAMVLALSFWVTALWFEVYFVKLIFIAGLLVLCAVGAVLVGIFKKPETGFAVDGEVVDENKAPALWQNLRALCAKVGTDPPDHVVAGIDDNFFVSEQPITVGDKVYDGRTLYVSLSLLKQLEGVEADAVMAHEMAHFSGQDTAYSKKISPLLMRYAHYLHALSDNPVTLPIYYFMICFRGMYELSLGRLSRQREFRADRIAAETTSPAALAGALMRIAAYSKYRGSIEEDLFKREEALESADIARQIEDGFHAYATAFASNEDIDKLETAHPFDSHPPMSQRMEALGGEFGVQSPQRQLLAPGDGRWFRSIDDAEQMERQQWNEYEERFRKFHEEVLAYRLMPSTDVERALVLKYFPGELFEGKKGALAIDFEQIEYAEWPEPVAWSDVANCTLNDNVLMVVCHGGKKNLSLKLSRFNKQQQPAVLEAIGRYLTRHQAAQNYQEEKAAEATNTEK